MGRLKGLTRVWFLVCLGHSVLLSQPRLLIPGGPKFDFGEIYTGSTVSRDLTLKNTGTDTLVISDISTACGCTGTMMSNDRIAPNDSGILSISFDSKKFTGAMEKVVTLNTNDPSHGHVRITFAATVLKSLTLEPEYLVFRTCVDSAASADLSIVNTGSFPIRILSAASSTDRLSLTLTRERLHAGEESVLKCTFNPNAEGLLNGTITITTDHPKIPAISVRFFALVRGKTPQSGGYGRN